MIHAKRKIFNKYRHRKKTKTTQKRIEAEIDEATRFHLQSYIVELKKTNREIGAYEANFAVDTLDNITLTDNFGAVTATAAQVNSLAMLTPVQLGDSSYTAYSTMMSNYWQKWTGEVDGVVKNGFVNGKTIDEISKIVLGQLQLEKSTTSKKYTK